MKTEQISRRGFLRRSLAVGAAAGAPSVLGACGAVITSEGDLLSRLRDQGSVKVGFANEAPYGFRDDNGQLTGEAPEVAREVLSRLDIPELEGVLVEFGALIPGLRAGNYDLIAAGMAITPDRCNEVAFSDPDYMAAQSLVVKRGNPLGLTDLASVAQNDQAQVAILQGGLVMEWAKAQGVEESQISGLSSAQNLLAALQADRVDAFTLTEPSANWLVQTAGDPELEIVEPFVPVIDGEEKASYGGYAFRQGNSAFRDAFNEVLNEMQAAGEILPIVEQFGFSADAVNGAKDKTSAELCAADGSPSASAAP